MANSLRVDYNISIYTRQISFIASEQEQEIARYSMTRGRKAFSAYFKELPEQ
jgi:hypothetical protein